MKFRRRRKPVISTLDITPLVDVVFLLLIFFMLSFGSPMKGSSVDLPSADARDELALEALAIVITETEIMFEGRPVECRELAQLPPETDIIILARRDVPYFRVVDVLDTLKGSGHARVSLATKPLVN